MIRRLLLASLGAFFAIGFGEPAVAQSYPQWPDVDCGAAKLTTTASQPKCRRGAVSDSYGGRAEGPIDCAVEQWAMFTRSPANFGFARLTTLRSLAPGCAVDFVRDIGTGLKSQYMRGVCDRSEPSCVLADDTTGWSDVSQIGDIYAASFTSGRGEKCKAFAKYGPPWQRGFGWRLLGSLCGAQGKSVSDGDLQSFVSSLIVRVQY